MRVSLHPEDRGYLLYRLGKFFGFFVHVYVDEVMVHSAETADTRKGYVLAAVTDEKGAVKINEARDDVLRHELHGKVRLEWFRQ